MPEAAAATVTISADPGRVALEDVRRLVGSALVASPWGGFRVRWLGGRSRWAALTSAAGLAIAAACSNATTVGSGSSASGASAPGISASEIDVGALATLSGPVAADFAPIVPGVQAYFDMINARGGVDGRKLVLSATLDDGGNPSQNAALARTLVQQDHVFAVVGVATAFFQGSTFLAQSGTPTFGYATQNNWTPAPNMFAAYGSVLSYSSSLGQFAYLATQLHATSAAVLAYGVPQSAQECQTALDAFHGHGVHVGFSDLSVPYGASLSSDVVHMKQAGVDFVVSCMDVSGNVSLSMAMQQNAMSARQLWLDGYDRNVLQQYSSLMQGTYFLVQHVPFEAPVQFPTAFPGMEGYVATMEQYEPQYTYNEVAMEGWLSADLFVRGLQAAGRHLTQQRLVNVINHFTAYTGGGLTTPVNWEIAHTEVTSPECEAYVVAQGTTFRVAYNNGSDVWVCFPLQHPNPAKPVPPPAGSPGS
jgi:ABC-type branched-subunit amino acid transport system substrate-binding protein